MISTEENITMEWLDNTQDILNRADSLMSVQTLDILMSLAEMNVVDHKYLTDVKISDVISLINMAKQSVQSKRESAKVVQLTLHGREKPAELDHDVLENSDHLMATILPFKPKVGRHYYNRM